MANMTEQEAANLVAGGIVGGMIATVLIFVFVFYVLTAIAQWKIFTKAGEAGWKALIPIYNVYILCKIMKISFWIYVILIPVVIGIIGALINNDDVTNVLSSLYMIFFDIFTAIKLGKAFNKGTGFIIGLAIFPNIFQLILGFGKSEYAG